MKKNKILYNELIEILKPLFGKKFCRVNVGRSKSFSIGFGNKIYHNKHYLNDRYYGEWEIGTYYCSWRIIKNTKIICGSNDSKNFDELNIYVNNIRFGSIKTISHISDYDIRIELTNRISIDFLCTISDIDEYFHIFCPNNKYIEYSFNKWNICESNKPIIR
jgi:hypothetical protein